jgi:hypothetical protein
LSDQPVWLPELQNLLERLWDDEFSNQDRGRLNELLRAGKGQQEYFITYSAINNRLALHISHPLVVSPGMFSAQESEAWPESGIRGSQFETVQDSGPLPPASAAGPRPAAMPLRALFSVLDPSGWSWPTQGGVLLGYLGAFLLIGAGLLAAWALQAPNRPFSGPLRLAKATRLSPPGSAVKPTPADRKAESAGNSKSAGWRGGVLQIGENVMSRESLIGKEVILNAGGCKIAYNRGTIVSLRGPFGFGVPTATSGALQYGTSTVRVEKGYDFTLSIASIQLTCAGGEFGVELDRNGDGWIQVFGGTVAVRLLGNGLEATRTTRTMSLGEGESLRFRRRDGACVATVIHDGRLAVELASRMPPRLPPQNGGKEAAQLASARKQDGVAMPGNAVPGVSGAGDGSSLLPVSTQDGPFEAAWPENTVGVARFTLSAAAPRYKLEDLVPGRCVLQLRFAARRFVICALRLNGKDIPLPDERFDGTVGQISAVTLRDGFLGGNGVNVLEFDVRATEPGQVLPRHLTGTDGPIAMSAEVLPLSRVEEGKSPHAK